MAHPTSLIAVTAVAVLLAACGGGKSGGHEASGTPIPIDSAEGIEILGESEVASGSRQTLRGSPDPADGTVSWSWRQESGTGLEELAINGSSLSYTAPLVDREAIAVVELASETDQGASGRATKVVHIHPADSESLVPVVDAGEDGLWQEFSEQSLYASSSARSGRAIRKLKWLQLSGPQATLIAGQDQNTLSLKLPQVESAQQLVFEVSAEDSGGFVGRDTVTMTVLNSIDNRLPVVDAGRDQSALARRRVNLQASASDADGEVVGYRWRSLPPHDDVVIEGADSASASLRVPNAASAYSLILELEVTDNEGATATDRLSIRVSPAANSAPDIVSVSADPGVVYDSEPVALSAQVEDAEEDAISYLWRQLDNGAPPLGIESPGSADARLVVPYVEESTEFIIELVADDGADRVTETLSIQAVPRAVWNPAPEQCLTDPLLKGCPLYPLSTLFDTDYYQSCADNFLSSSCLFGDLLGSDIVDCLSNPGAGCQSVLTALADPSYLLEQIGPEEPADHCTPAFDATSFEHYRGALHEHTAYSDGTFFTRPENVFEQVRDRGFDFAGNSDHSDTLGIPLTVGRGECPPEQFYYCYLLLGEGYEGEAFTKWVSTLEQAEAASVPGQFTGIRGFEWTSDRFGHANVYFSRNFLNAKTGPGYAVSMALFWEWFTQPAQLGGGADGLLSFNHPGREDLVESFVSYLGVGDPGFTFNDFRYIDSADYRVVGIEVFGKGSEYDSGGPDGSWFAYALDKGWHLAPISSEDHHGTDWGGESLPKTVLVARSVALDDLREAMLARRTYAVAQHYNQLQLDYRVDGEPMGARLRRPAASSLPVEVSVNPNRTLNGGLRIQLVGAGNEVLREVSGNTLITTLPVRDEKYYAFVRVYDGDRPIAFAAPVWILPGDSPLPYCQPPEVWSGDSLLFPSLDF